MEHTSQKQPRLFENNSLIPKRNQSQIREKMYSLKDRIQTRENGLPEYKNPQLWVADGLDHINIHTHGETDLGQALAHGSPVPFKHSIFGYFASMESFWHYIQSEERLDSLRTMGHKGLAVARNKLTFKMVTNFRAIIMDSNYQRIVQNEPLKNAMKESDLPFELYYNATEHVRQRPRYALWLLYGMEEIRRALKEDRQPDFSRIMDNPSSEIYEFVMPATPITTAAPGKKQKKKNKNNPLVTNQSQEVQSSATEETSGKVVCEETEEELPSAEVMKEVTDAILEASGTETV